MKITEMTREQLRDYMKANRELYKYNAESEAWKYAFKLAKVSGLENLEMDCTGCIKKVAKFIDPNIDIIG